MPDGRVAETGSLLGDVSDTFSAALGRFCSHPQSCLKARVCGDHEHVPGDLNHRPTQAKATGYTITTTSAVFEMMRLLLALSYHR